MVSQDSPSNPNSSILHQFIISNSISNASQNQFGGEHFDSYATEINGGCTYHSLGTVPSLESLGEGIPRSIDLLHASPMTAEPDHVNHTRHLMNLLGASNDSNFQLQRLSLSLGTSQRAAFNSTLINPEYIICGENQSCSTSHTTESFVAIGNSKYLKPAQLLLEEMVKVSSKAIDLSNDKYVRRLSRNSKKGSLKLRSELNVEFPNDELFTEKHELHAKVSKLIALLEEVERRSAEYYHHMDELIGSFESVAGLGAGKSYTALALQAMSRHFCSLRDAISSQICVMIQKISEDMPKISTGLFQLSLFDRENRHNRMSLQQLGIIQSTRQAWRPIRGLPETSVTILRSWLFEHFLHPYPNDSEKLILASQTGLTKNQVSNWFINARVRLWKPMIEEMYKEEFADSSVESNPSLTREGFADSAED